MSETGGWRDVGIDDEAWIGVGEAARLARVDPSTMRRWVDAGKVRARVTPGGTRQISRGSLRSGFQRETAARQAPGKRKRSVTIGPDPGAEHAPPESALPYLVAASSEWSRWTPRHLPKARLEQLQDGVVALRNALDDIDGVITDELRDRDADDASAW
jgi:hypothetical protein